MATKKKYNWEGYTARYYLIDKDGNKKLWGLLDMGTKKFTRFISDEEFEEMNRGFNKNINSAVNDILMADPNSPIRDCLLDKNEVTAT